MPTMQPGAPRNTGLLEKVAAIAEDLKADAAACDEMGRVTPRSKKLLETTDVVKFLQPKDFGGLEGHPTEFVEGCIEIASLSSSAGWIAGVVGVHPHEVALGSREMQEEIWGPNSVSGLGPETWIASPYAPQGVLTPTDGGYIFNGHWSYSSGCDLCQWVTIGAHIADADGVVRNKNAYHVAVPAGDYEILHDSWNVFGLTGTGSKDLVIKDKFVPAHRVIATDEITEGSAAASAGRDDAPIYYLPRNVLFAGAVTAATVGIAKGVVDAVIEINRTREARHGKVSTDPFQLSAMGHAAAEIDASICHVLRDIDLAYEFCKRGEMVPLEARATVRRNQVAASLRAAAAADSVFRITGGTGIYAESGLERRWRDSQAAIHHIHNLGEQVWQSWSLVNFGLPAVPSVKL